MSEPRNVTLQIGRGGGLSLRVNDSYMSHTMESLVVSELSISAVILETLGPIPPRRRWALVGHVDLVDVRRWCR